MVMRVKVSPAREPKALEPPAPPKAPAKPPPLPRWISTSRIRNTLDRISTMFITGGSHVGTSASTTRSVIATASSFRGSVRNEKGHYKRRGRRGRAILPARQGEADDRQEIVRPQARGADEGAVHVGLVQQRRNVLRFGAAAVLDRKRRGRFLAEFFRDPPPHERVRLLRLLRRRDLPGADGPHRFVRQHHVRQLRRVHPRQAPAPLRLPHPLRP